MIRVLQVIGNMNAGGMETMLMNYYRKLDRSKIQFDFLIFNRGKCLYEEEIISLGGRIFKITSRRKNFFKNRREIKNFFKDNKYEIVEFHQGITYYYPLKQAKKYGVKHRIIHNHGINRKYLKYLKIYNEIFAKKRITNLGTDYFSCSENVNKHLFTDKIIKEKKVTIINNAININNFKYNQEYREKIREEFKISANTKLIGHIGTFTKPKNHQFILKIFNEYQKINKDTILLLVGTGPLENEIKEKIKSLRLENKVIITKNRKDINQILSAIDVMIFPSIYEGIPLTLIEAQANGLDILVSKNVDHKSVVLKNVKPISLENDELYWAKEIDNINNRNNREYGCYKMLETQYNIEKEVKKIEKIYKRMV